MNAADIDTIDAVIPLDEQLRQQQAQIARQQRHIARLEADNRRLSTRYQSIYEQLRLLIEQRFGPSTEKYRIEQADLFFDEAETLAEGDEPDEALEDESASSTHSTQARRRGGRVALPPELPRVEVIHDLPEDQKICPEDGAPLKPIGQEISEQLDVIPAQIRVIRHVRLKYACPVCEEGVTLAPQPAQPLPKSNASPALLAYVATAKYQDALPLYRQEQIFTRLGVDLSRNTLARWMIGAGHLVNPLIERLRQQLVTAAVIHMDETTVQVNTEPGRAASSTSYMWVQRAGPPERQIVLFHYEPTRAGSVPLQLLEGFTGSLITDGYEGYNAAVSRYQLTHAVCWAHARRGFIQAQKLQPKGKRGKADKALNFITQLYAVEKQAKAQEASPQQRLALRKENSAPVIEKFHVWLQQSIAQVPPKGTLGKALGYALNHWSGLTAFLKDGRIPLDNNPAENAIRPFVIGRKNWLFSHTPHGARASAALYSLIETAKANGIEPYGYLVEVFTRLPQMNTDAEIDALLPWHYKDSLPA